MSIDEWISQYEVIERAQPIADVNNPVYRLCLKESTDAVYVWKNRVA